MDETDVTLNYFKDSDGNYIIRRVYNKKEDDDTYIVCSGSFSSNFLFSKKNFEKKIEETLEKIATQIEESVLKNYKIKKEDIIFEKVVGNFVDEKKFNPMFSKMSKEEISAFCSDSIKAKININFEFNIMTKKRLKIRALMEFLFRKITS